jgi:hypothetical protein
MRGAEQRQTAERGALKRSSSSRRRRGVDDGCGCCCGFVVKKIGRSCRPKKKLLEEDDYEYNESNRKRVMTAHQIMKFLTGEMVSNPPFPLQGQFERKELFYPY